MTFVRPGNSGKYLNEFSDQVIALKWNGQKSTIDTKIDDTTVPSIGFNARLLALGDNGLAEDHGNTLVFQRAIQNQLETNQGDWVVGKLSQRKTGQKDDDGREQFYYLLDDDGMTEIDFSQAVRAFERLIGG